MLAELDMDSASIMTGLLHDTVEDTGATLDDLRELFGDDVDLENLGADLGDRAAFEARQRELLGISQPGSGSPAAKKYKSENAALDSGAGGGLQFSQDGEVPVAPPVA